MLARRLARTTAIASSVRFRFARIPKAQPFSSASQSLFKTATMSAQGMFSVRCDRLLLTIP